MTALRKYRNEPTTLDGERFDSKAEAARWAELRLLAKAGAILKLRRQVRYPLFFNGALIATYVADFTYTDAATRATVVEDVKGVETQAFRIKAKLFAALYGFPITIIKKGKRA